MSEEIFVVGAARQLRLHVSNRCNHRLGDQGNQKRRRTRQEAGTVGEDGGERLVVVRDAHEGSSVIRTYFSDYKLFKLIFLTIGFKTVTPGGCGLGWAHLYEKLVAVDAARQLRQLFQSFASHLG
jgi:hypothetical protein